VDGPKRLKRNVGKPHSIPRVTQPPTPVRAPYPVPQLRRCPQRHSLGGVPALWGGSPPLHRHASRRLPIRAGVGGAKRSRLRPVLRSFADDHRLDRVRPRGWSVEVRLKCSASESLDHLSDNPARAARESPGKRRAHSNVIPQTLVSRGCRHLCNATATSALFRWHGDHRWTSASVMWRSRVLPCNPRIFAYSNTSGALARGSTSMIQAEFAATYPCASGVFGEPSSRAATATRPVERSRRS
jgi:hypothetical protein